MEKLQELINKKAEKRLKADLSKVFIEIRTNHNIFRQLGGIYINTDNGKKETLYSALFQTGYIEKYLLQQLLPEYISYESEEFIRQVESLQVQLNSLTFNE